MEQTMRAVVLDRFGGPDELQLRTIPMLEVGRGDVLIRVAAAGVGEWDPFEREGGYAELLGLTPAFPYVLGSEGAGTVVAVGADVAGVQPRDQVYAAGFLNPRGGFYAEYAAVDAALVVPIPPQLAVAEAGALAGVGLTALRGLEDVLALQPGETLLIFGASGGVGHVAIQLARRMGARVLAVASGADGAALARRLGADAVVDGRAQDVLAAGHALAPDGIDAALLTAGGAAAQRSLAALRPGARIAYPRGVQPEPQPPAGMTAQQYDGAPDADILARLNRWIGDAPFTVHLAQRFALEDAAAAHRRLDEHYLGKLVLTVEP